MNLQNAGATVHVFLRRLAMGALTFLLLALPAPSASALTAQPGDPLDEVNPLIGTGGRGFGIGSVPPGAQVPFGLVRLSPDTALDDLNIPWRHTGGYHYRDTHIRYFSHLHMVGAGTLDAGNIGVMPVTSVSDETIVRYGYRSRFKHAAESAAPGWYRVTLHDPGIEVELTATKNVGLHRYSFDPEDSAIVLVDLFAALGFGAVRDARIEIDTARREVSGWVDNAGDYSGRFGGYIIHFVGRFNRSFEEVGTWTEGVLTPGSDHAEGRKIGGYIDFGRAGNDSVELALALSLIDETQARVNLARQVGRRGFDDVRATAQSTWREALAGIEIEGGTAEQRTIFFSALYHAQLAPTELSESGERYMGFDREVHDAEGWAYHSDLSLWDTFRTLHPLLVLIAPERQRDVVRSMVAMYEQGGDLPKWAFMIGYTGGMIGSHSDVVIADTYLKGITDFDVATAYRGMREHAMGPRPNAGRGGIKQYIELGYCPNDLVAAGTSRTCEFAYDDWAIANLAEALGEQSDHELFMTRSESYRNVWDAETAFFRGRNADGSWVEPLLSTWVFDEQFIEGDAWQWRWFAPHDAPGLIDLFGSNDAFVRQLRRFFSRSTRRPDTLLPDPYYWHGNEPDIHAAYLFNDAGRPDLTQKWVRWIMKTRYGDGAAGLDGNDDYGTLSAWYVFSAMGLYPLAGSTRYWVGSPIFDSVTLHLATGDLRIVAHDAGPGRYYIQGARIDDAPLDAPFIDHGQIAEGATLEFWMGDQPSSWGR